MNLAARLEGRSAFVTGASSGLGAHFARLLAGCRVGTLVLGARRQERLDEIAAECTALGAGAVVTLALDVTDEASVAAAFADPALSPGLDLLVNNAGVAETAPALETASETFDRALDTNLRGAWLCALAAARLMREAGTGGDIVNVASILGLRVSANVAPYAISKAGLVQMTRALGLEWARHGIRVNALAPGYIATELNTAFFASEAGQAMIRRIPMRRLGQPGDLDAPFLLLASGTAPWMTGTVLTVDGGHAVNSL